MGLVLGQSLTVITKTGVLLYRGGSRILRRGVRVRKAWGKLVGHHAHFTCHFHIQELRVSIFYTLYRCTRLDRVYAAAKQDWHGNKRRTLEVTIKPVNP